MYKSNLNISATYYEPKSLFHPFPTILSMEDDPNNTIKECLQKYMSDPKSLDHLPNYLSSCIPIETSKSLIDILEEATSEIDKICRELAKSVKEFSYTMQTDFTEINTDSQMKSRYEFDFRVENTEKGGLSSTTRTAIKEHSILTIKDLMKDGYIKPGEKVSATWILECLTNPSTFTIVQDIVKGLLSDIGIDTNNKIYYEKFLNTLKKWPCPERIYNDLYEMLGDEAIGLKFLDGHSESLYLRAMSANPKETLKMLATMKNKPQKEG